MVTDPVVINQDDFDHFIVTDALGQKQDLYVANLIKNPELAEVNFAMPPKYPQGTFDARFEQNHYLKAVTPDTNAVDLVIDVDAISYPITLTWDLNPENGIEYAIQNLGKDNATFTKTRKGFTTVTQLIDGKLHISSKEGLKQHLIPAEYKLAQNYPNPFNPSTRIRYSLAQSGKVILNIYNILGKEVKQLVNRNEEEGTHEVLWDASNLPSGVYFYKIQAGNFVETKKMMLLK